MADQDDHAKFHATAAFAEFVSNEATTRGFDNEQMMVALAMLLVDAAVDYGECAEVSAQTALEETAEDLLRRAATLMNHLLFQQDDMKES